MTILLVDDEKLVLDVLARELPWGDLGIDQVLLAQSARQAMEIFARQHVDILLCDIEMPQRSGLQLLADLKNQQIDVVSALLTAHADFAYAREAVSLGALEYVTKPAPAEELQRVIRRCADEVRRRQQVQDETRKGRRWAASTQWLKRHFWQDAAVGRIPATRAAMAAARASRMIEEPLEEEYLLLVALLKLPSDDRSGLSREDLQQMIPSVLTELSGAEAAVSPLENTWAAVIPASRWPEGDAAADMARNFLETMMTHQQLFLMACLVEHVPPEEVAEQIRRVHRRVHDRTDASRLLRFSQPLKGLPEAETRRTAEPAPLDEWRRLLLARDTEKAFAEVYGYLYRMNEGQPVSEKGLNGFLQDFLQMIYTVLHAEGIHSAELYEADNVRTLLSRATSGVDDMIVFCGQIMIRVLELLNAHRDAMSVSESIRSYIAGHLGEELNRDIIARHVGFSPEHVSRVFKQETGMNLVNYIQTERLNAACGLLISSTMSVSEVAARIGYDNFAYFSKAFRKFTGLTPSVYRRGKQKEEG